MRRWLWRVAIVVVLIAAGTIFYFALLRPDPVPVTVFVVERSRVEETVTNSKAGTVRARRRARLSPEIGGRVSEVCVSKGERVSVGTALIRLDEAQYAAQVRNAERALEAARQAAKEACLTRDLAMRELARAQELARAGILSDETLDQAMSRRDVSIAACDAGDARVRQLESQVDLARAEAAKAVLRAPFDGIVADLSTERGEWITPSPPGIPMPAVLDIIDTASIYVSAPLDEIDRGRVSEGLPVRITMDAHPGQSFPGSLTRIAPYIMDIVDQSRTFEIEATFDDEAFASTLPPGASADVEVILQAREDALRIPTYALIEGRRVLILEAGRLVGYEVETGLKNWEFAEITDGLREGQRVVVSLDRAEVKDDARAREIAVTTR